MENVVTLVASSASCWLKCVVQGVDQGKLGAGQDDGFGKTGQQERQRGGCERHRIGPMGHHEPVILGVILDELLSDAHPVRRSHVGAWATPTRGAGKMFHGASPAIGPERLQGGDSRERVLDKA